jgi:hypothetical protein
MELSHTGRVVRAVPGPLQCRLCVSSFSLFPADPIPVISQIPLSVMVSKIVSNVAVPFYGEFPFWPKAPSVGPALPRTGRSTLARPASHPRLSCS